MFSSYSQIKTDKYKEVYDLRKINESLDIVDFIRKIISDSNIEDNSFFVADLDEIYQRHVEWLENFPRVEPLYAVKSNYDCHVIKLLAYLGIGFDCSSQGEIETLLQHKISPSRILFANPCKNVSHIKYASKIGVNKLVFDNEYELIKIKNNHPNAECLLRIKVNSLPAKFGADMKASIELIKKSIDLNINLVGISFYVGFRQKTPANIIESIKNTRYLFDYARENYGYVMNILDIGGGFPGTWQTRDLFHQMAININNVLDEYFPSDLFNSFQKNGKKFEIISELGTYYTTSAYTLCVNIIAKRSLDMSNEQKDKINKEKKIFIDGKKNSLITNQSIEYDIDDSKSFIYYINDSVHASFKWYDLNEGLPIYSTDQKNKTENKFFKSSIAGATCDSGDFILRDCYMPELNIGEFIIFRNMGSYTKTCAVPFNDIPLPQTVYVSTKMWNSIKNAYNDDTEVEFSIYESIREMDKKSTAKDILNKIFQS